MPHNWTHCAKSLTRDTNKIKQQNDKKSQSQVDTGKNYR